MAGKKKNSGSSGSQQTGQGNKGKGKGRLVLLLSVSATAIGCGGAGGDINDAFNSRDSGHYEVVQRQVHADGTVVLRVRAQQPEHARVIAEDLVVRNYEFSPTALSIIVEPAAGGASHAYRWDPNGLRVDSAAGAPVAPGAGPPPGIDSKGAPVSH